MFSRKTIITIFNIFAFSIAVLLIGLGWRAKQNKKMTGDCPNLPLTKITEDGVDYILLKQGEKELLLIKKDNKWLVKKGEEERETDSNKIDQVFFNLAESKCFNLASTNPNNQEQFGMNEEDRLRVEIKNQDKDVLTFWLGKVGLTPQTTYIRHDNSEKVYTLKSTLRTALTANADDWVKKELTE